MIFFFFFLSSSIPEFNTKLNGRSSGKREADGSRVGGHLHTKLPLTTNCHYWRVTRLTAKMTPSCTMTEKFLLYWFILWNLFAFPLNHPFFIILSDSLSPSRISRLPRERGPPGLLPQRHRHPHSSGLLFCGAAQQRLPKRGTLGSRVLRLYQTPHWPPRGEEGGPLGHHHQGADG